MARAPLLALRHAADKDSPGMVVAQRRRGGPGLNRETDIDEVLQTHTIFTNVSKGLMAKREDLTEAFGDLKEADIVLQVRVCSPTGPRARPLARPLALPPAH